MKTITAFKDGKFELSIISPVDIDIHELPMDCDLIEGVYDDTYYFDSEVARKKPPPPSEHHLFDYATKQWVDPRTPDTEWKLVRAERDRRLLACDWTQLPDVPLATKEAWASYRQALRDITEQPDPFNITWPAAPG